MPSDIRSFFGGKPAGSPAPKEEKKPAPKRGRAKKVVDDSEDEEECAFVTFIIFELY